MNEKVKAVIASKPFQYVAITLIVVGVLIYVGVGIGKRKTIGKQAPYPKGDAVPEQWVKLQAPIILKNLADNLLGGSILVGNKANALRPLLTISDAELTYVYNEYNTLHHPGKLSETLYSDINDDFFGPSFLAEGQIKSNVLQRMLGLNLI